MAVLRALGGGAVMAVALGLGLVLGDVLASALGARGTMARLLPAVCVTALALPPVLWAARRRGAGPALGLAGGGAGAALRAFLAGAGITAGAAALVLGAGTAAGLLHWSVPDLPALFGFLLTNGLVALLLEALPEETTLRGYTWSALRGRFGGVLAACGTTAVFLLVPAASTVVRAVTAEALGQRPPPVGMAPGGQPVADYLVLLGVFGLTLVAARTAPVRAPLWAAVGTHLTFLTVNRVVWEGEQRSAGWSAESATPDAVLLVPLYLLVTAAVLSLWRRAARGRRGGAAGPGPGHGAASAPSVAAADGVGGEHR